MAITSFIIDLSGTVTFTDNTTLHFHGQNNDGTLGSVTGNEGYQASAEIHNETDWEDILSAIFVQSSWAISNFSLSPTGTPSNKTINDMILNCAIKCTTDGDNINSSYIYPPWSPNPGLGTGTYFDERITYQGGRRTFSSTYVDALITEIGDDATSLARFRAAFNAALENVNMTIV